MICQHFKADALRLIKILHCEPNWQLAFLPN